VPTVGESNKLGETRKAVTQLNDTRDRHALRNEKPLSPIKHQCDSLGGRGAGKGKAVSKQTMHGH